MNITAGKYKGQKIIAPDEKITRPTLSKVRMAIFNTLQAMIDFEGKSFLDMFAGSGVMGLEALSRGFSRVVAIEKNSSAQKIIKQNYANLNQPLTLLRGDSLKICPNDYFDVIYIDPPYFSNIYENALKVLPPCEIIILEQVCEVNFTGFIILKQKNYGNKTITFLKKITC